MDLLSLFLITTTIFNIFGIVFFLTIFILILQIFISAKKFKEKADRLAEEGIEVAEDTKLMIEKIGNKTLDYILLKIFSAIKSNKSKK